MKRFLKALWYMDENIRLVMAISRWCHARVPGVGRFLGMFFDRTLMWAYSLDVHSPSVRVAHLSMSHPAGVLLGGNGIVSNGRVVVMSGVKFVGGNPADPEYLRRHATRDVFRLGDNVAIGANAVIVGPLEICDDVTIGAAALVNRSITEPGIYAGVPAKRIGDTIPGEEWVVHLPRPAGR